MTTNYRVNLGFANYADGNLITFAAGVVVNLTSNASFPTLPVSLANLENFLTTFQEKLAAQDQGGTQATAEKNAARDALIEALRQIASYIQTLAGQDLPKLLSSGYQANSTTHTPQPLAIPTIQKIVHGNTTQLFVSLNTIDNARAYEVQVRSGTGNWQTVSVTAKSREILLDNLTPGTVYDVQVRAIGGSTGSSLWSAPVSQMVT
jgi:hypothetical protein